MSASLNSGACTAHDSNLANSEFHNVNLSGAKYNDVNLRDTVFDIMGQWVGAGGGIDGVVVNHSHICLGCISCATNIKTGPAFEGRRKGSRDGGRAIRRYNERESAGSLRDKSGVNSARFPSFSFGSMVKERKTI
jgi:hypothetical protein